jgi:hypothetical protein
MGTQDDCQQDSSDHVPARSRHTRQLEVDHLPGKNERAEDAHQGEFIAANDAPGLAAD